MKKVFILMATYNGEKYLREQIDSLLNQKDIDVFIRVADDRSTDSTPAILEEYKKKYKNFDYYINEKNKGFTYNFLDLYFSIKNEKFDYCAFSDQDDVWLDDKVISGIKKIEEKNSSKGCVYCSNLKLVDENLNEIGLQETVDYSNLQKYSFIASNLATGCTMVVDKKFYDLSMRHYPEGIHLHDYWLFLIGVFAADYVYDYEAHILYRQHGNNQIGSNKKISKAKIDSVLHPKYSTTTLLKELLKGYEKDISEEDLKQIKLAAFYKESRKSKRALRRSKVIVPRRHKFFFKFKVAIGKY